MSVFKASNLNMLSLKIQICTSSKSQKFKYARLESLKIQICTPLKVSNIHIRALTDTLIKYQIPILDTWQKMYRDTDTRCKMYRDTNTDTDTFKMYPDTDTFQKYLILFPILSRYFFGKKANFWENFHLARKMTKFLTICKPRFLSKVSEKYRNCQKVLGGQHKIYRDTDTRYLE